MVCSSSCRGFTSDVLPKTRRSCFDLFLAWIVTLRLKREVFRGCETNKDHLLKCCWSLSLENRCNLCIPSTPLKVQQTTSWRREAKKTPFGEVVLISTLWKCSGEFLNENPKIVGSPKPNKPSPNTFQLQEQALCRPRATEITL